MKYYLSTLPIVALLIFGYNNTMRGRFERLKSYIPFQKEKIEIVEKRWVLPDDAAIVLKNNRGSITVDTNPQQTVVSLAIEKKTHNQEQMDALAIEIDKTDKKLSISTVENEKNRGSVFYRLTLPEKSSFKLSLYNDRGPIHVTTSKGSIRTKTTKGNITVIDACGPMQAFAQSGNVTINNPRENVKVFISKRGHIHVDQPKGDLSVATNHGRITIRDSAQNVVAYSKNGAIKMTAHTIPQKTEINLTSTLGSIELSLPETVNADVQASSKRGTVVCQHPVKLKSYTTTLDQAAWTKFKNSIDGTIGTGESRIIVQSDQSNIKIEKNKTT